MSGFAFFLLILIIMSVVAVISFIYGFKFGIRAERNQFDLRQMIKKVDSIGSDEGNMSEMEVTINEQIGFWHGEPDDVDSNFCENYMSTLAILMPHMDQMERHAKGKWKKVKPVWEKIFFNRVTMNTAIKYELNRDRMLQNLKELLIATGRKPSRRFAA